MIQEPWINYKKKIQSPISKTETAQPWNQISDNRAYKQTTDNEIWVPDLTKQEHTLKPRLMESYYWLRK